MWNETINVSWQFVRLMTFEKDSPIYLLFAKWMLDVFFESNKIHFQTVSKQHYYEYFRLVIFLLFSTIEQLHSTW